MWSQQCFSYIEVHRLFLRYARRDGDLFLAFHRLACVTHSAGCVCTVRWQLLHLIHQDPVTFQTPLQCHVQPAVMIARSHSSMTYYVSCVCFSVHPGIRCIGDALPGMGANDNVTVSHMMGSWMNIPPPRHTWGNTANDKYYCEST